MARRNRLADMLELEENESDNIQEAPDKSAPVTDESTDEDIGDDEGYEEDESDEEPARDEENDDDEDWSASYFRKNKAVPEKKPGKLKTFAEKKKQEREKAKAERIRNNYKFQKKKEQDDADHSNAQKPFTNPEIPDETFDDFDEDDSLEKEALARKRLKRQKYLQLTYQIILSIACVYVLFLIYGVIMTDFAYNQQGKIEPQVMTVKDVQEKKQFEIVMGQYENCRELYEKVLMLDYRISQGIEDPLVIAPEYNALLDDKKSTTDVSDITGKIKGMDIPAKYSALQGMMLTWVSTDVSEYLQLMNDGLAMNDSGILTEALSRRAVVLNDFSIITENIVSLGSSINGVDLTETKQWNPDSYIEEAINGE